MAYIVRNEKTILERSSTEYVLLSTHFGNFPENLEKQCLPYSAFKEQPFLFLVDVPVTPFIATLSQLHLDKQWTLTCPGKHYSFLGLFCSPHDMSRCIVNKEINTSYIDTRVHPSVEVQRKSTVDGSGGSCGMGELFESCWNWLLPIFLLLLCVSSQN